MSHSSCYPGAQQGNSAFFVWYHRSGRSDANALQCIYWHKAVHILAQGSAYNYNRLWGAIDEGAAYQVKVMHAAMQRAEGPSAGCTIIRVKQQMPPSNPPCVMALAVVLPC